MEALKIQESDCANFGCMSMPDSPTQSAWSAVSIKGRIDSLVRELVAQRFNALIDLLASNGSGASEAGTQAIGAKAIAGLTGDTAHAQLSDLKSQLNQAANGNLIYNSVTDAHLSDDTEAIKARFLAHIASLTLHIGDGGMTGGTGAAYTATVPGFSQDAKEHFILIAHTDCAAGATLAVGAGAAHGIHGASGAVAAGEMKAGGAYLMRHDEAESKYRLLNPETVSIPLLGVTGLETALSGKANAAHSHAIANVNGLQAALESKAMASHTHSQASIASLVSDLAGKAPVAHSHTELAALFVTGGLATDTVGVANVCIIPENGTPPVNPPVGSLLIKYAV
jgi:hypothetical protein